MRGQGSLAGTGTMIRLILRRDRIRLPIWVLGIVGIVGVSANAVQGVYATPHDREIYADTIGNSAGSVAMGGPPVALRTMGGVTVFETSSTAILAIALMGIFLTIRHTRTEEEGGRTELLRAARLGRLAPWWPPSGTSRQPASWWASASACGSSRSVCPPAAAGCSVRPWLWWVSSSPASRWSRRR
jgi:putative exporter of polyketide antibiotics